QLPFALAMGAVGAEVFRGSRRRIFWGTAALTLAMPTVWAPTLRGYPDAGGAAFLFVAVWLHLRNAQRGRSLGTVIAVGVSLACAILFRRHYVYAVIAFCAAAVIEE